MNDKLIYGTIGLVVVGISALVARKYVRRLSFRNPIVYTKPIVAEDVEK